VKSQLESVLTEFSQSAMEPKLGRSAATATKADDVIPARLEPERLRANFYFLTCVVLVCILFAAELVYIFLEIGHPERVQGSVAVFGASTFTLIIFLVRIVRNRERVMIIISLSRELGPEELRATLGVLRDEWFPNKGPRGSSGRDKR
jgi:hypothetical protein